MILSVSRRTDIPAFYSDWFFNRIKAGFVDVRNPMNIHRISRIDISPEVVDCIVFWTKNPKVMIPRLEELSDYKYYFQFTVNPYDRHIEEEVPLKRNIFDTFHELSDIIGVNRIVWRYDPILMTKKIDVDYHIKYFEEIAKRLSGYSTKCIISFVDLYKKVSTNISGLGIREPNEQEIVRMVETILPIARSFGFTIQTCSEKNDLQEYGIEHGACIDSALISEIIGCPLNVRKDKNQRNECGCVESIDIGEYNTCCHHCVYCYANFNQNVVRRKAEKHDPFSSLLVGEVKDEDIVSMRKVKSLRDYKLF